MSLITGKEPSFAIKLLQALGVNHLEVDRCVIDINFAGGDCIRVFTTSYLTQAQNAALRKVTEDVVHVPCKELSVSDDGEIHYGR